jgi:hypothetical protein
VKETSSNNGFDPKVFVIPWALMIGGKD